MHSFNDETHMDKSHKHFDIGIEPLSEGLGGRHMYGSPFRDINHGSMRLERA